MSATVLDMSMSLDGYVTGPNDSRENPFGDSAEMLHDWIADAATDDDRAILQATLDGVGAIVMGRTSFDKNEGAGGWGDAGPLGGTPLFGTLDASINLERIEARATPAATHISFRVIQ